LFQLPVFDNISLGPKFLNWRFDVFSFAFKALNILFKSLGVLFPAPWGVIWSNEQIYS